MLQQNAPGQLSAICAVRCQHLAPVASPMSGRCTLPPARRARAPSGTNRRTEKHSGEKLWVRGPHNAGSTECGALGSNNELYARCKESNGRIAPVQTAWDGVGVLGGFQRGGCA